jgi:RHS repeat-associated protein
LSYDIQGDVTSVTDALGNSSTFKYDSAGRLSGITDPNGSTAQFSYSGTDQVSITDSLGRSITQFFDGAGRRISVTNPLGQTTQYQYDPLNNVTKITDPLAGSTLVTYDANGNTLTVADPVNPSTPTTYTYDSMNRVATRRDPLGNTESFQYDANGNLSQFTDRRGKVATFSYDALDRLMFAGYGMQAGPTYESTVTYTYDAGNRLVQVADSASGTFTLGHDNLDRLTSETGPQGTISYTYDAAARRITSTVAGQATVNYTYDAANRLTQISQGTATVSFGYDAVGRRGSLTVPNGITVNYNYDAASELTGLTYSLGAMSLGSLSYAYDNNGLRTSTAGSYARTGLPNPLTTAAYNANNELTTWGGANLSYDANGNLTGDGTHTYAWDARNRLIAIDGGSTASFAYDPFGRRTGKTILGTTTSYLYDNNNLVQELSGASASANWLTGLLDDEYFTRTDSSGVRNFLADALGTTIALADSTGTIQTQYTVEPYGNTTTGGAATTNSVVYAAREMDLANLYFFRARYYNPQLGRFISEDPAGFEAGMNFYAYVHNSPIDFADPTGSFTVDRSGLKQQRTLFIDGPCGAGTGGACTRMDYVGVKADCAKGKCSDDWKATAVALVEQGTMYIYNGPWNTLRLPPKDKSVVDAKTAIAHEFNVHINPAEAAVAPLLNAFEAKTFKSKEDCIIEHGRLTPIVRSLFNQTLRETQQRENNQ